MEEPIKNPGSLNEAEQARLMSQVEKLGELEEALVKAQFAVTEATKRLTEAAARFQQGDEVSPEPEPEGWSLPANAVCVIRDNRGEFVAWKYPNEWLYRNEADAINLEMPWQLWILDGEQIIAKGRIDQEGIWWA